MSENLKIAGIGLASFLGILFLVVVLNIFDLEMFKYFEPKREDARREVYENTKSYVHGKVTELAKLKFEWDKADSENKKMIESTIRNRFANLDSEKIDNYELKQFLTKVRGF